MEDEETVSPKLLHGKEARGRWECVLKMAAEAGELCIG